MLKPKDIVYIALERRVPLEDLVPYETPDRKEVLRGAREEVQKLVAMLLSEKTDAERLQAIGRSFGALPEGDRLFGLEILDWDRVLASIPNLEAFLEGIKSLAQPIAYWINEQGQLVIGDGHPGIRPENKGEAYSAAEARAESFPNRGLITGKEHARITRMPRGKEFEKVPLSDREGIWVQSDPAHPTIAYRYYGPSATSQMGKGADYSQIGVRYVVRTPLSLQTP